MARPEPSPLTRGVVATGSKVHCLRVNKDLPYKVCIKKCYYCTGAMLKVAYAGNQEPTERQATKLRIVHCNYPIGGKR